MAPLNYLKCNKQDTDISGKLRKINYKPHLYDNWFPIKRGLKHSTGAAANTSQGEMIQCL